MSSTEIVERMHFFDGQRLDARDLSLEQHYHMLLRRLLNKGLFSAGVVEGLEVKMGANPKQIKVGPGLALDPLGREIVLVESLTFDVPNQAPPGALGGYFLVIRYHERPIQGSGRECEPGNGAPPPSRVIEQPKPGWTQDWPNHAFCTTAADNPACGIVLALVLMDATCTVQKIDPGPRQFAHTTLPSQVHAFALEGEKDIDVDNPKELHFDLRGGVPNSILLVFRGDAFSSFYYTQIGQHSHKLSAAGQAANATDTLSGHKHDFANSQTDLTIHRHKVKTSRNTIDYGEGRDPQQEVSLVADEDKEEWTGYGPIGHVQSFDYIEDDGHVHTFNGAKTGKPDIDATGGHTHTLLGTTEAGGISSRPASLKYTASVGVGYGYPDDVQVAFNGHDITLWIQGHNTTFAGKIGDGTAGHLFVTQGTSELDLIQAGVALRAHDNVITFALPSGGGRLMWNLFIE